MSRHNYSQYSNNKKQNNTNVAVKPEIAVSYQGNMSVVNEVVDPVVFETVTASTSETPIEIEMEHRTESKPEPIVGTVFNCTKLNVRVKPRIDADVVCVIDSGSEVKVDVARSSSDWFKVSTAAGIEGYCMRKFVNTRL